MGISAFRNFKVLPKVAFSLGNLMVRRGIGDTWSRLLDLCTISLVLTYEVLVHGFGVGVHTISIGSVLDKEISIQVLYTCLIRIQILNCSGLGVDGGFNYHFFVFFSQLFPTGTCHLVNLNDVETVKQISKFTTSLMGNNTVWFLWCHLPSMTSSSCTWGLLLTPTGNMVSRWKTLKWQQGHDPGRSFETKEFDSWFTSSKKPVLFDVTTSQFTVLFHSLNCWMFDVTRMCIYHLFTGVNGTWQAPSSFPNWVTVRFAIRS